MFLETGSVLRKKGVDDRQKDQKILKRVNKELLQTQETNLSFGTVQLILKKFALFSLSCVYCA
jgi:hypothetical protein